jgi:hypothetical protein
MSRCRICCAIGGTGILVAAAVAALWWHDTIDGLGYCSDYLLPWQWFRCAIASYKLFPAALGGATGALMVGWLSFVYYA